MFKLYDVRAIITSLTSGAKILSYHKPQERLIPGIDDATECGIYVVPVKFQIPVSSNSPCDLTCVFIQTILRAIK